MNLTNYIRAGFAGIYLQSQEELLEENKLKNIADNLGYKLYRWSIDQGLLNVSTAQLEECTDPIGILDEIAALPEKSICILSDYHSFLGDPASPINPLLARTLKQTIRTCRLQQKVIIVLSNQVQIPNELEKEFVLIQTDLPTAEELGTIARSIAQSAKLEITDTALEQVCESALGLTTQEAEDIFALSVVEQGKLEPEVIAYAKANTVKKSGLLELIEADVKAEDIGGLEILKSWLNKRKNAFGKEALEFGLPAPKGLLLLGIPGTGKSLCAKATGAILQRPILKLDAGKLFAGIVGESEANLRKALQTAEAMSPCVLWLDEMEKAFSGAGNGSTDGGVAARVFGSFLNWMQEKDKPVFVVATANDISKMPPELLRKGRFDELFFVDLPSTEERKRIWEIQILAHGRSIGSYNLNSLAKSTDGYTGAEIAQCVIEALYLAYDDGEDLKQLHLQEALSELVPLSQLMSEDIKQLRRWAEGRTRRASLRVMSKAPSRKLL
jgi:AAA+ superfamily predicted ATPase